MVTIASINNDTNKVTQSDAFTMTSVGLMVEGEPSKEEWISFGRLLVKKLDSLHWIIGDWLNYGMDHYNLTYQNAAQLLNEHGFTFCNQTLRNDKYVAAKIPLSWRHDELSWQHHKEVASLSEERQKYWLSYASEMGITTKELRKAIKGSKSQKWLRISNIWDFEKSDDKYGVASPCRIPGQIIQNLIFYYTKPNALVVDPLAIDGTTADVCMKCAQTKRESLTFDIQPMRQDILEADATKPWPTHQPADFIFVNALRHNINRFNQNFGITLRKILGEAAYNLKSTGVLSILIEPWVRDEKEKDWSFEVFHWMKHEVKLKYERRITLPIPSHYIESRQRADAKRNKDLFSRILEVLVFRKGDVKKCSRCGIVLHGNYADSDNSPNGGLLCPVCRHNSQQINLNEKDDIVPLRTDKDNTRVYTN